MAGEALGLAVQKLLGEESKCVPAGRGERLVSDSLGIWGHDEQSKGDREELTSSYESNAKTFQQKGTQNKSMKQRVKVSPLVLKALDGFCMISAGEASAALSAGSFKSVAWKIGGTIWNIAFPNLSILHDLITMGSIHLLGATSQLTYLPGHVLRGDPCS